MHTEQNAALRQRLCDIVAAVLELDQVSPDASFTDDLGVDSLERVEIATRITQQWAVGVTDSSLVSVDSVDDAVRLLLAADSGAGPTVNGQPAARDPAPHPTSQPAPDDRVDLVYRLVGQHLAGTGDRSAYRDPDVGEVSYRTLHGAARRYATRLAEAGVAPGGRGLIVAEDSVATVVAVLGLWWHGCVPVPVSPLLGEDDLRFIVRDSDPAVVHLDTSPARQRAVEDASGDRPRFTGDGVRDALRAGRADRAATAGPYRWPPRREALLQYTSGSTGRPKGVRQSAGGIAAMLDCFGPVSGLRAGDVVLATPRMSFGFGFGSSILCPLDAGATTVVLRGPVTVTAVADAVRHHRPTVLCAVPRVYAGLLDRFDHQPLPAPPRLCLTAGEDCPPALRRRIRTAFGATVMNGLGATELMHIVIATPLDGHGADTSGVPVPGVVVTVRDRDGRPLPDGEVGRLHVAGPTVALGYLDRPDATRETFADGGVYTGDLVRRNADGTISYLGRFDGILNLGGYKVVPGRIEQVARSVPGVADCAMVGTTGGDGLQEGVLFVVAVPGADPDAVRRSVNAEIRTALPVHQRPNRVQLLPEMPTTVTGKVARHRLRDLAVPR